MNIFSLFTPVIKFGKFLDIMSLNVFYSLYTFPISSGPSVSQVLRSFSVVLQATKALFTFFNHFSVVGLIFFLNDVSFILKLIDSLLCHSHCVTELIYGVVFVLFLSFRVSV